MGQKRETRPSLIEIIGAFLLGLLLGVLVYLWESISRNPLFIGGETNIPSIEDTSKTYSASPKRKFRLPLYGLIIATTSIIMALMATLTYFSPTQTENGGVTQGSQLPKATQIAMVATPEPPTQIAETPRVTWTPLPTVISTEILIIPTNTPIYRGNADGGSNSPFQSAPTAGFTTPFATVTATLTAIITATFTPPPASTPLPDSLPQIVAKAIILK